MDENLSAEKEAARLSILQTTTILKKTFPIERGQLVRADSRGSLAQPKLSRDSFGNKTLSNGGAASQKPKQKGVIVPIERKPSRRRNSLHSLLPSQRKEENNLKSTQPRRSSLPSILIETHLNNLLKVNPKETTGNSVTGHPTAVHTICSSSSSSSSLPDITHLPDCGLLMNLTTGANRNPLGQRPSATIAKHVRNFFCERALVKLICSLPLGLVFAAIVRGGIGGDPILFIGAFFLLTGVIGYPLVCSSLAIYRALLPYYQLYRYSSNSKDVERPSTTSGKEQLHNGEEDEEVVVQDLQKWLNDVHQQTFSTSERWPALRRISTLPSITETISEEEEEEETHYTKNVQQLTNSSIQKS